MYPGCTMVGYMPPYLASLGTSRTYYCCPVYRSSCPVLHPLPEEGALGSKKENLLGKRTLFASKPLILLRLVGDSAQSYSLLPA